MESEQKNCNHFFSKETAGNNLKHIFDQKLPEIKYKMAGLNDVSTLDAQDVDLSLNLPKKKRKKKITSTDLFKNEEITTENALQDLLQHGLLCKADQDYDYNDLLTRIYSIVLKTLPNNVFGDRKKMVLQPPQVIRIGTKKTSFVNFLDVCKTLHRTPQHLQSYILAELGTSGSIDSNHMLIIKGRYEQRHVEAVLRHYIKEYVSCPSCHSPDTYLQKDSRLCFLQCESCGSRSAVAAIKRGFRAVISRNPN